MPVSITRPHRAGAISGAIAATAAAIALAAGCTKVSPEDAAAGDGTVTVTITDEECTVDPASVAAGKTTFEITNPDSAAVTEAELVSATGRILGERENLTPGLSGSFSLNLEPGDYSIYCPGATSENTKFAVTGDGSAAQASAGPIEAQLADGVAAYADYVKSQTASLVTSTTEFADAIKAGDLANAKELYGPARTYYERIEPIAESFGDLDPAIDARINDVDDPAQWTGFHPLEKLLWEGNTTTGGAGLADKLVADVTKLDGLVQDLTYQPADLANGATSLLDEVSKSKITGEEEAYSHLDLLDFFANTDGAKRAFDLLKPALQRIDAELVTTIEERFTAVNQDLAQYKDGASYVDYTTLTQDQVRSLATKIDSLAEALSQVAEQVADYK